MGLWDRGPGRPIRGEPAHIGCASGHNFPEVGRLGECLLKRATVLLAIGRCQCKCASRLRLKAACAPHRLSAAIPRSLSPAGRQGEDFPVIGRGGGDGAVSRTGGSRLGGTHDRCLPGLLHPTVTVPGRRGLFHSAPSSAGGSTHRS